MLKQSFKTYQDWLRCVEAIKLLNRFNYELRAHRGSSTAELCGDTLLQKITRKSQHNIVNKLKTLDQYNDLFSEYELEIYHKALINNWLKVQRQSKYLSPIKNFKQHCSLLEDSNTLIWLLACRSDPDLNDDAINEHSQLTRFILKEHCQTVESIARLRGICIYICAQDRLTDDLCRMASVEIKRVFNQWNTRQDAFYGLPPQTQDYLNHAAEQEHLTKKLIELIDAVSPLQKTASAQPNASELFNAANWILNAMEVQFTHAIDHSKHNLPEDIRQWISPLPQRQDT